jgi:hypothetical protein
VKSSRKSHHVFGAGGVINMSKKEDVLAYMVMGREQLFDERKVCFTPNLSQLHHTLPQN